MSMTTKTKQIIKSVAFQEENQDQVVIKDLDSGMSHSVDPSFMPVLNKLTKVDSETVWDEYWQQRQNLKQILFKLVNKGRIQHLLTLLQKYTIDLQQYQYIDGWTLLHHATILCNYNIVEMLVNYGANINRKTKSMGRTCLHLAVLQNNQNIVRYFLQEGGNPNIQDIDFCTPVHYAIEIGHIRILQQFLQSKNIDFSLVNHKKMTALDCCRDFKTKCLIQSYCGQQFLYAPQKIYVRRFIDIGGFSIFTKTRADYVQRVLDMAADFPINQNFEQEDRKIRRKCLMIGGKISESKMRVFSGAAKKSLEAYQESLALTTGIQSLEDYDILRKVGSGSYGQVFLARKKHASKLYAIKRMEKRSIIKNKMKKYIYTERQILKTFHHPFIVSSNSFFQDDWYLYFVMQFCEGGDLQNYVKREKLPEELAKKYCCEIVLGLQELHRKNYLFRDLKVANVLVDSDGHLKLTDFGLAKQTQISYSFLGSVAYLAPEMLANTDNKMHSAVIDWYLLGVFCYELLTGYPPFYSHNIIQMHENIRHSNPKIPQWVSDQCKSFLKGTLTKSPIQRLGNKGAQQIKQHKWFRGIDWQEVLNKKLEMPKPNIDQKQIRRKQMMDFEEENQGEKPQRFLLWDYKSGS